MARSFLTPINLNQLELQNARVQNLSTTQINAISSPVVGQVVYDTTVKTLKVYDGSSWAPTGSSTTGSGAPNSTPTTVGALYVDTTNDVLYVATGTASSADWAPALPYGTTTANLGGAAAAGTSLAVSRADHVHRHTNDDHGLINLSALAVPTGDVAWAGYKITGLADPTSAQDAATKNYVDAVKTGLDVKQSVRAATTAPGTLATAFANESVVDGVTLATGDRILIKNQTDASENGIYVVNASGAPTRAADANSNAEVTAGMFTFVAEGTANADSGWVLTTNDAITLGTTELVFAQFSGAGQVTAGDGLTKTGNTLDVGTASTSRIVVNANNIDLAEVTRTDGSGTAGVNFIQSFTTDAYGRVTGTTTADVRDATTSTKGVASFSSNTFSVSSGAVDVKTGGISNSQLANDSITVTSGTGVTVSGSPVALGGSVTVSIGQDVSTSSAPTFAGLSLTDTLNLPSATSSLASLNLGTGVADPATPDSGDFWRNAGALKFYNGTATKTLAFTDSTITGNAANVTGVVAIANGGTGATSAADARTNLGGLTRKTTGTNASGTTTTVNHGFGQWVTVQVFETATGDLVECDITNASTDGGTSTITTAASQTAGALTYVIVG